MAFIPIAIAVVSAISALSQAGSQAAAAESQQKAANYNATVSQQNATSALQVSNAQEDAQRRRSAQAIGSQRAAIAESGLSLTEGTGSDLTDASNANAQLDALNVRYTGTLNARGYTNEATLYAQQAAVAKQNKSTALTRGWLSAGAAALSGYGSYQKGQAGAGLTGG